MTLSLSSDDVMPFHGYRTPLIDSMGFERGSRDCYPTIQHFLESEKFRGVDEVYRQHVISLPTAREARKAAARREYQIRPDWEKVQNRVMAAGIWFKLAEHDRYAQALLANPDLAEDAYPFRDHYWGDMRQGVSSAFYKRLLIAYREKLRNGVMRVSITGSPEFADMDFMWRKLNALFRRAFPDEVLINCDRGTDSLAERWAIAHGVPVAHYPLRGGQGKVERLRRANIVLSRATHVIVFWQGTSVRTAEFVTAAKTRNVPMRVFRFDARGALVQTAAQQRARRNGTR